MKPMNAAQMHAIIQIHEHQKPIQCRKIDDPDDKWTVIKNPSWDFSRFRYRSKPQERYLSVRVGLFHSPYHHGGYEISMISLERVPDIQQSQSFIKWLTQDISVDLYEGDY